MRIFLLVIFAALSGWLAYDRSKLQDQLAIATDKMTSAQKELDAIKNQPPAPQKANWLAERIKNRTDMLGKPPQITTPFVPAVRPAWNSSATPYPYYTR